MWNLQSHCKWNPIRHILRSYDPYAVCYRPSPSSLETCTASSRVPQSDDEPRDHVQTWGGFQTIGYSDSSYADEVETRRSSAGYAFTLAGGAVSWKAKTQRRVSSSTGEAEYIGIFEGGKQAKWMTSWYFELDQYYDLPVSLHCDNRAAKALAETANGHSKIKHVAMKSHGVRESVRTKGVKDCRDRDRG